MATNGRGLIPLTVPLRQPPEVPLTVPLVDSVKITKAAAGKPGGKVKR